MEEQQEQQEFEEDDLTGADVELTGEQPFFASLII
jgi:hypothetical protein